MEHQINCEHDLNGDVYYVSASGKTIYWHTYRKWASFTTQMRSELIQKHHEDIDDPIVESGVSCSKCKALFRPRT